MASSKQQNVKYKCPFCDKRMTKINLVEHVGDIHEDMLPEGFTPLRYVFNYVNRKSPSYHGRCVICKKDTEWDENKGRYNRLCGSEACKKEYIKRFEDNMNRTKGTTRISQTAEGQAQMLANRKISGTYTFQNGVKKTYTGSYELNALKFMDQVMNINPDDIMCPGPILEYTYEGKKHMYITDFYYVPYNLIIEVKDGGKNPNKRNMPEYRGKQIAKEEFIINETDFNYLRLTDNDMSQLLAVFMDLKMQLVDETMDRVVHVNEVNENILNESLIKNEPDIYYNKDKFDSGEINLCFITGHSGSGKSTMGRDMEKLNIEHYELDDLQCIADYFTMDNLKEYGDLIYSYFKGEGKKFYKKYDELVKEKIPGSEYEDKLFPGFVHYAMKYAKSHKNKKFVIEGIWFFETGEDKKPWFEPYEFDEYAFYIKGTSMIISKHRAALRDAKTDGSNKKEVRKAYINNFFKKNWKWYFIDENRINKFRNYFKKKLESTSINEAMTALTTGYIPGFKDTGSVYIVNNMQNMVFCGVTDSPKLDSVFYHRNKEGYFVKESFSTLPKVGTDWNIYATDISIEDAIKKLSPAIDKKVSENFVYNILFEKEVYGDINDQLRATLERVPTMEEFRNIIETATRNFINYDPDGIEKITNELEKIKGEIYNG